MSTFDDSQEQLERILDRFEREWPAGGIEAIARYLPQEPTLRTDALWELAETDLELRIKAGHEPRVEHYLAEFAPLRQDTPRLANLIRSEFEWRSRLEPDLTVDEFLRRFPDLQALLMDLKVLDHKGAEERLQESVAGAEFGAATIGSARFRLIQPHREGGLGKIWKAFDRELSREVALKEIKPQFADDEVGRSRFVKEAVTTGQLEHPGIAPVYGLGRRHDGAPYYAMRFVQGRTLQEEVEAVHQLPPRSTERIVASRRLLGSFLDLCNVIRYAHDEGILHRDIKPNNVMIGKHGETLVIDWGLAKSLNVSSRVESPAGGPLDQGGPADLLSTVGRALGSPAYMSPEQARGETNRLDRGTDIYSLGATLYTIVTNTPPVPGDTSDEVLENVRTGNWPKPRAVDSSVSPVIEAVILKAMARHSVDRYASVRDLAHDVERYLADEPVSAWKESWLNKVSRVARKNRTATLVAAAALVVISILSIAATVRVGRQRDLARRSAVAEKVARTEAEQAKSRAERALDLFVDGFGAVAPEIGGRQIKVIDVLDNAVDEIAVQLKDQPAERGILLDSFAQTYARLALYQHARQCAEASVDLLKSEGASAAELLKSRVTLGLIQRESGQLQAALEDLDEAYQRLGNMQGDDHPDTIRARIELAAAHLALERHEEALVLLEPQWEHNRGLDRRYPLTWQTALQLSKAYMFAGDYAQAIALANRLVEFGERQFATDHPTSDLFRLNQAEVYFSAGRANHVIGALEETVARRKVTEGAQHPRTLSAMSQLGYALNDVGRHAESVELLSETLELHRRSPNGVTTGQLYTMNRLAEALFRVHRIEEAAEMNREALCLAKAHFGEDGAPLILAITNNLALNLDQLGKHNEAADYFRGVADGFRRMYGPAHMHSLNTAWNAATMLNALGRSDEALAIFHNAADAALKAHGADHRVTIMLQFGTISIRSSIDALVDVTAELDDLRQRGINHLSKNDTLTRDITSGYLDALIRQRRFAEATQVGRQWLESLADHDYQQEQAATRAVAEMQLAEALLGLQRYEEATKYMDLAMELLSNTPGADTTLRAQSIQGAIWTGLEKYEEAEELLLMTHAEFNARSQSVPGDYDYYVEVTEKRLAHLYQQCGNLSEAAKWSGE